MSRLLRTLIAAPTSQLYLVFPLVNAELKNLFVVRKTYLTQTGIHFCGLIQLK